MISLGITAAERALFATALQTGYRARTIVTVLDRDEKPIGELPNHVLGGGVDVKAGQRPDRVLQLEMVDDGGRFRFAPEAVADAHIYVDNMLQVERGVYVPDLGWVDVPVFCGPIANVKREGRTISVTATGKEARGLKPAVAWQPAGPFGRDRKVTDVIRSIMRAQGERRFDLPNHRATIRKQVSLGRQSEPWAVAQRLAKQIDRQLFYDGRGVLRMRYLPQRPVWSFVCGTQDSNVLTIPSRDFDTSALRNVIEVLGREPEGSGTRPRAVAIARKGHPLSPWSLARNGEPLFLVETIEVNANREAQLERIAQRELQERLQATTTVQFEAVPVLTLEPDDLVELTVDDERYSFRAREYTIPLTAEGMTFGFNRRPRKRGRK